MTIKSALNVCKEFAKETLEFVKSPVKSTKAHCGRFWNDMSKKEKAVTVLKVTAAAVIVGVVGALVAAALVSIAPSLTFVAVPLILTAEFITGLAVFLILTRQKKDEEAQKNCNIHQECCDGDLKVSQESL